jgi:hypothetical protein
LVKDVKLCEECSYDFLKNWCVICNSEANQIAKYCRNCVLLEKDWDGCPKIVNMGISRKDWYFKN